MQKSKPKDSDPDWSKFKNPKMRAFFEKGLAHIRATGKAFAIKPTSPEFAAWVDYFDRHVGERPQVMLMAMADRNGDRTFTVPTEWPEWFTAAVE